MRFNSVLISSFLLVSAGLADCHHMDRRSRGVERLTNVPSTRATKNSPNWAGAVWEKSGGTFYSVEGTFKVPEISGPNGYGASAWVGLDGDTCAGAMLHTGVLFTVTPSGPLYQAWYEWFPPSKYSYFTELTIAAGDVIRLVVSAPTKATYGFVMVENLSKGQSTFRQLESIQALCGQNAEWIVEDYLHNGALAPLVNFGTVNFTDAKAGLNTGGTYGPQGATIFEIMEGSMIMTNVSVTEDLVSIKYGVHQS